MIISGWLPRTPHCLREDGKKRNHSDMPANAKRPAANLSEDDLMGKLRRMVDAAKSALEQSQVKQMTTLRARADFSDADATSHEGHAAVLQGVASALKELKTKAKEMQQREKEASATVATEAAAKVRALTDASFARIDALHTSAGKASHNTRAQEEDLSDEDLD